MDGRQPDRRGIAGADPVGAGAVDPARCARLRRLQRHHHPASATARDPAGARQKPGRPALCKRRRCHADSAAAAQAGAAAGGTGRGRATRLRRHRSRAPAGLRPRPAGLDQGEQGRPRAAGVGAGRRREPPENGRRRGLDQHQRPRAEPASRLGLSPTTSIAGGKIVIFTSDQLSLVQTLAHWLKVLAWVLPFVSLALYALAVYLATGYRRRAVRNCGIGIIVAGVILVIGRTVGGNLLVDNLVKLPENRSAASAAWDVITGLLKDTTRTVIAVGFIIVIWAWVSGEGRRPVSIRRAFAPHARDHVGQVWVAFTAIVLFLIWWAPTMAFRRPVPALVMIVLAGIGLEAVRRQSVAEFPDAESGGVSSAVRAKLSRPQQTAPAAAGVPVDQLERLSALHDSGALTDQEFQAMKSSLLP